jgi:hypothetical protein
MRKINGRYYFIYSSENSHELCYATSDKPDGDFRYGGTIVSIGDVFLNGRSREDAVNYLGNTHGSIEQINGQWYVFYHRQTNLHQFSRQGCAEPINIMPDGSIPQVEVTSCGLSGGILPGCGTYEARIACNLRSKDGVFAYGMKKPENTTHPYFTQEGSGESAYQFIANMRDGSMAGFKYFGMDGADKISVIVRGEANGFFTVFTGTGTGSAARIEIKSDNEWHEVSSALKPLYGKYPLYFIFNGNGILDFLNFSLGD